MFILSTWVMIVQNLQLLNKNISVLKIDKSIKYPPAIWSKIRSLLLVDKIENNFITKAVQDKNLRDFISVNIQGVGEGLYKKHKRYMGSQDYEETFYLFRKFGFLSDGDIKGDEEALTFLVDLTNEFSFKLGFLKNQSLTKFSSSKIKNFNEYLGIPLKTFLKDSGFESESKLEFFDIKDNNWNLQNLFLAWQDKSIFERMISKIIEDQLKCKVYCSPYVVVDEYNPLKHSLEFDNIFISNNKICFLELKNGNITRNKVFEFLGKVKTVEKKYNIKVDKIAVLGTGTKDPFFDNLTEYKELGIFGIDDYRNDFKEFFNFLKV